MTTEQMRLEPCPFCGMRPPSDLSDTLYPGGIWWRENEYGRSYHSHADRRDGDQRCMSMHCTENMGGCGAKITADTGEEVIAKWNRRASQQNQAAASQALQKIAEFGEEPAEPVAVPGWKLVPMEATAEMLDAGCPVGEQLDHFDMKTAYAAMLAATPPPPQGDAGKLAPLTDEQRKKITAMWSGQNRNYTTGDIIDAVEAAHGIGPEQEGT